MKNYLIIVAMVATGLLLLTTSVAEAQTTKTETPASNPLKDLTFDTPERNRCVTACYMQKTPPETPLTPIVDKPKKRKCPKCCVVLRRQVKVLKQEIVRLTSNVSILSKNDKELKKRIAALEEEVQDLERVVRKNTYFIATLVDDVKELRQRLDNLEHLVKPIHFGPFAGFTGFLSTDGTSYIGFPVGVRLSLSLNDTVEVGSDLALLFSSGDRHFGSSARGFLGFTLIPNRLSLETGFSGAWCEYNSQADARSLFITGDLGLRFTLYKGLWVGVNGHLGTEIDKDDPAFAGGGKALIGIEF